MARLDDASIELGLSQLLQLTLRSKPYTMRCCRIELKKDEVQSEIFFRDKQHFSMTEHLNDFHNFIHNEILPISGVCEAITFNFCEK